MNPFRMVYRCSVLVLAVLLLCSPFCTFQLVETMKQLSHDCHGAPDKQEKQQMHSCCGMAAVLTSAFQIVPVQSVFAKFSEDLKGAIFPALQLSLSPISAKRNRDRLAELSLLRI